MEEKLQELTQRIYQEGIAKGKEEADLLISNAQEKAKEIVSKAHEEAERIRVQITKQSEEMKKNVISELRIASEQMLSALKQRVSDLIVLELIKNPIDAIINSEDFYKEIILILFKNWNEQENIANLNLILPASIQEKILIFLKQEINTTLSKEMNISFTNEVEKGFIISHKDLGYYISFTDQNFNELFKNYLKPKAAMLIFGE